MHVPVASTDVTQVGHCELEIRDWDLVRRCVLYGSREKQ